MALSGGVDSSVAAALMVEQGHEVVGVTLKQWAGGEDASATGCCTVADAEDARRVAGILGIRHYVLDYVEEFEREVVGPFAEGYLAGRTPNPCIECNRRIRFGALLERADRLGCDLLATGHHARVQRTPAGYRLLRGADASKDQSYVLHVLGQAELARVAFPIGGMTKAGIRAEAEARGMRTATKPDSQDLCFVATGHRAFLERRHPDAFTPGPIVTAAGTEVGRHDGAPGFTVGQRRGLGLAAGEPRFVLAVRPEESTVVVGTREELLAGGCRVSGVTWVAGRPPRGDRVGAKLRYRSPAVSARLVEADGGSWQVWFDDPVEAAAPGQAAVFYRDDEVLGGGTIEEALSA